MPPKSRIDDTVNGLRSAIQDATAMLVTPHCYVPDHQAMGDCRVCGHPQDAEHHEIALTHKETSE